MAETRGKKKTTASGTAKKKSAAKPKDTKAEQQAKKQMWAVVLFAIGILLGALTFIKGDRLWLGLHNFLFGMFGWSTYFLAPLLLYIAVVAANDRPLSSIKAKVWQAMLLVVILSGAIQIFGSGLPKEGSLAENIAFLFGAGKEVRGGGVAGAVFAFPLIGLFEKTGAAIIITLMLFVFFMLVSGSTLIGLYHRLRKPVENLEDAFAAKVEERQTVDKAVQEAKPRFDIDVDIGEDTGPEEQPPMPEHPVRAESGKDKILSLLGKEPAVEYIPEEEFAKNRTHQEGRPPAQPEEPVFVHPLEEEILQGVKPGFEGEDDAGIEDIVGRFVQGQQARQAEGAQGDADKEPEILDLYGKEPEAEKPPAAPRVYAYPSARLLKKGKRPDSGDMSEELKANAQTLVDTLKSFGVQTRITDICRGPAVTRYELQPSAGVKISRITGLADDIALNLASAGIRIEAPIPNKAAVGIEVPNKHVSVVHIRDLVESKEFGAATSSLSVALGKDIAGNITIADLGKMPHVLIAGATGSGKSVCINSIIISLLYKSSPDEVKLLMVDPKVVELGVYNGIPHLLVPVVTDPKKAAGALSWAVSEMLNRYKIFAENSVRDLVGYNRLAESRDDLQPMPKIVIIIDELADLMMAAPNEVEDSICRLAQMARAAGMHLVIATQRPSVDVITGVIKANIPSRVAFAVSSQVDSRTILDMGGAEKLLGRGDMLFYPVGASKPQRVQGCFVTDGEVESVVEFVKQQDAAEYSQFIVEEIDRHAVAEKKGSGKDGGGFDDEDDMLPQAIECVIEMGQASTSALQRRLKLGYARAARMIDQLEQKGIVGPFEGSKPRQVLISRERWLEMKLSGAEDGLLAGSAAGTARE